MAQKISEIIRERLECEHELVCLKNLYEQEKKKVEEYIKELSDKEKVVAEGLDLDKIEIGKKVLSIKGNPYTHCQDTHMNGSNTLAKLAIADILDGCKHLRTEFFGQKRYAGFHQRSDHRYGYGPSHGDIVESVGLRDPNKELTEEEVEAAVYFLTVWERYNKSIMGE